MIFGKEGEERALTAVTFFSKEKRKEEYIFTSLSLPATPSPLSTHGIARTGNLLFVLFHLVATATLFSIKLRSKYVIFSPPPDLLTLLSAYTSTVSPPSALGWVDCCVRCFSALVLSSYCTVQDKPSRLQKLSSLRSTSTTVGLTVYCLQDKKCSASANSRGGYKH